jgi:DNA-binding transcriptional LysR family regulator
VLALADLGSFARAAIALRLSQPALSRSIQGVEGKLGTLLILRARFRPWNVTP